MTTYTVEEGTWAGAEIWAWDGPEGQLIGRASFVANGKRVHARVHGRWLPGSFVSPEALLVAVEEALR